MLRRIWTPTPNKDKVRVISDKIQKIPALACQARPGGSGVQASSSDSRWSKTFSVILRSLELTRWSQELFYIYIIFQASCDFFMSSRSRFRFGQKSSLFFTLSKENGIMTNKCRNVFSGTKSSLAVGLLLWRGYPWYNLVQVYGMWVWERIGPHSPVWTWGEISALRTFFIIQMFRGIDMIGGQQNAWQQQKVVLSSVQGLAFWHWHILSVHHLMITTLIKAKSCSRGLLRPR